jgi:hypothetical protein
VDEAATLRITSLPVFLLGSTFHGIKPLVKHQMAFSTRVLRKPNIRHGPRMKNVQASIAFVGDCPCMPRSDV